MLVGAPLVAAWQRSFRMAALINRVTKDPGLFAKSSRSSSIVLAVCKAIRMLRMPDHQALLACVHDVVCSYALQTSALQ